MSQDARRDEELSTAKRAGLLGFEYLDTSAQAAKPLFKDALTPQEMYSLRVIPISVESNRITFGITTTTSQQTIASLKQRFIDATLSFVLISDTGYKDYMKLYDPPKQVVYQDMSVTSSDQSGLIEQVSKTLEQVRADDMLAYITQQAHKLAASDIHIENQLDAVRIRFRIDGVLHPVAKLSVEKNRMLTSAIASAGNISTSSEEAQQGHIRQRVTMADGHLVDINLRVETVPSINGMDIVMRLFNMNAEMYSLDRLGLSTRERQIVEGIIQKPSGLVLAVGPTGSGKTTTLYSMLNSLNTIERKIITIEDPVEYQFEGITQISVTSKNSEQTQFANKLRAVLRLDPDVVMVGEVRDLDTAKTALQASLTGHLVLSTFHAGSTAAALTRLMDVIGQNPLFLSAIRLIMAQRLVRRLDPATRQAYEPDATVRAKIQEIVASLPPMVQRPDLSNIRLYKPGKSESNPFGYSGQIALREQMVMTDGLVRLLQVQGAKLSALDIEKAAIKDGMITMLQSAVYKMLAGETSADEVFRVLG